MTENADVRSSKLLVGLLLTVTSKTKHLMMRATHDGHDTEGATRNYNTGAVRCSFINGFDSDCLIFICAAEEGYEINCVGHFLAS